MSKIIIHNDTEYSDAEALEIVDSVIRQGRISESSMGKQYCYVTTFKDGTVVYASKPGNKTDTFRISAQSQSTKQERTKP